MKKHTTFARRARQAGFTLVEMMVAITIGLVVVFGMLKCFQNRAAKLAPSCRTSLMKVGKLK